MAAPVYRRILLKLSGEALLGSHQYGIDPAVIRRVAVEVTEVVGLGVQVGLVIGGGNRQPVLHDRYRSEPARDRDWRGRVDQGHEGRRRVLGGPDEGSERGALWFVVVRSGSG